jgi:acid phosphatase (class A)
MTLPAAWTNMVSSHAPIRGNTQGAFPASAEDSSPALLTPEQVNAALVLPPPPVPGSAQALEEISELQQIAAIRTPSEFSAAARNDKDESPDMFASALGERFDLAKLPATNKMLIDVGRTEDVVSKAAKAYFHRDRPWLVISPWQTCVPHTPGPARNSYPSGHATIAYAMGVVLASLIPAKAQAILESSSQFAESRLVCGVHFRSDIVAGQVLGTVIAGDLFANPRFRAEYDAAAVELDAAHLR